MALLAYYNEAELPCITLPMENIHSRSKRYLGRQALTGKVYATLNWVLKDDIELEKLHIFWRHTINYGLEHFIISLPLLGNPTSRLDFIALWDDDFKTNKVDIHWTVKAKLQIVAPFYGVTDDNGNFITDDSGFYIYTDGSGLEHSASDNIISYLKLNDVLL